MLTSTAQKVVKDSNYADWLHCMRVFAKKKNLVKTFPGLIWGLRPCFLGYDSGCQKESISQSNKLTSRHAKPLVVELKYFLAPRLSPSSLTGLFGPPNGECVGR